MKRDISLARIFAQQNCLKELVQRAEKAVEARNKTLNEFNEKAKKQVVRELSRGKTTGDPLTDEIVAVFGLDKAVIDRILTFNKELMRGKEILVTVPYQTRFRFGSSLRDDDFTDHTGFIFGILSGDRIMLKTNEGRALGGHSVDLPLRRYIKWGFERNNSETPVVGPLTIEDGSFEHLDCDKLLMLGEELDCGFVSIITMGRTGQERPLKIIIDGKIAKSLPLSDQGQIKMALEHGRQSINLPTPSEKLAGAGI